MKQALSPSSQSPLTPEAAELRSPRDRSVKGWAARWRRAYGRSADDTPVAAGTDEAEVWMEYHNPMLGLTELADPAG